MTGTATEQQIDKTTGRTQSRGRALLTPDEIVRPPQGSATLFSRYATSEYATYAILLARLTRIYERQDVKQALKSAAKGELALLKRPNPEIPYRRRDVVQPLCSREELEAVV